MNEQNRPEGRKEATNGGKRRKKLPLHVKIYRALYTAVYVGAQLIRECALFLYEKVKPILLRALSYLYERWIAFKRGREEKKSQQTEQSTQQPDSTVVFGKTVKKTAFEERKKREYVEEDFLDFEEEKSRAEGRRKSKKEKKRDGRPSFEEYLRRREVKTEKKKSRRIRLLIGALIAVLCLQLLCGLFALGLFVYTGVDFRFGGIEMYMREGNEYESVEISAKYAYGQDGRPRVNMTALAAFLEIETVSDRNMIYYTLKDGSRMVLMKNSRTAVLNGALINLSERVIFSGKQVYVPLELLTDYTDGLSISYSQKEDRLTLRRYTDPLLHTERNPVYKELTLTVCALDGASLPQLNEPTPSNDPN